MQSRSHRDSEEVFVKKLFCLGLLSYSILYHILHFSVYKTFFTVITSRSLSKKKAIYMVHCCTHSSYTKYSCHHSSGLCACIHLLLVSIVMSFTLRHVYTRKRNKQTLRSRSSLSFKMHSQS